MSTLEIKDLYAHVETKDGIKPILKGVNLTVNSGETHAIMGPNGSGKSTLAYTLAGHPKYVVDSGQVLLDGEDILKMLALGADAVLIGRPAAVAAVGGGAEGVKLLLDTLKRQLMDAMMITGVRDLSHVPANIVRKLD